MVFQSIEFVLFFVIVFACYWMLSSKFRWGLLLTAGIIFYASWSIKYVVLLFSVTMVSYFAALSVERLLHPKRKYILIAYIVLELGILGCFKYLGFFSEILNGLLNKMTVSVQVPLARFLLPIGISFYIFQTMGYVLDVYSGKITAERHFGYLAASVAFFPIMLSGPIEKCQSLICQFKEDKKLSYEEGVWAFQRILSGCLKKMIIADSLAIYIDKVYSDVYGYTGVALLFTIILYSVEIYCDFSGYSDIATGIAGLLGIKLKPNFKRPYFADSMKEFWRRWHISLTLWFREYVYIPLGGNRIETWKVNRNVMVTFLLSGLWHGASWTFVFWGAFHGCMQIIERTFSQYIKKIRGGRFVKQILVFGLVSIGWVFFRADNFSESGYILTHCLQGITSPIAYITPMNSFLGISMQQSLFLTFFIVVIFIADLREEREELSKAGTVSTILLVEAALFYYLQYGADSSAFIYFQF